MQNTFFQKNIITKKDYLFELIIKAYKDNLEAVVLFGSVARGDFAVYSDIDLLVVLGVSNLSFRKRIDEFYENVGYYFGEHFLSPLVLKSNELDKFHPMYLGIFDNYMVLYDKSGIIDKVVQDIKKKIEKGVVKEEYHHSKYWRISDAAQ